MHPSRCCPPAQKARQQASLEPLKKEYSDTAAKVGGLADRITAIDPTWEPPTAPKRPDRILEWVKGQGKPVSKAGIAEGLGTKYIGNALKKMVEKAKTLSFDKTAKTYSVPA